MDPELEESLESMESSWTLLSWLASFVMVFGGAVPYIPQYQEIQKTSNTEGFSTRVCLVLLIANILRIFFWVGKQFELTLLVQSVVMILTMLAMLHLCCTVQISNRVSTKQHRISETSVRNCFCIQNGNDADLRSRLERNEPVNHHHCCRGNRRTWRKPTKHGENLQTPCMKR